MPAPYHGTVDYTIPDTPTGVDDTTGLLRLDTIINNIDPDGTSVDVESFIGNQTLLDGGVFGKLLRILRVHLEDMKNRNELTESMAGEVYSNFITHALSGSLEFLFKNEELKQTGKQRSIDMILGMLDIENKKLLKEQSQEELKLKEFSLKFLMPKEHESLTEKIELQHIEHQIKDFYKSDMQPIEKSLLTSKSDAEAKELEIRTYYKSDIQPVEKTLVDDSHSANLKKLDIAAIDEDIKEYYRDNIQEQEKLTIVAKRAIAEKELLVKTKEVDIADKQLGLKQYELDNIMPQQLLDMQASTCGKNKECDIKSYYYTNIQPEEKELAKAKAFQEVVNAGNYVSANSLPTKRIAQLVKQTDIYEEQRKSYDFTRFQKLLDTQLNYHAMIFPDLENPSAFAFANDTNVNAVYNELKPD